MGANYLKKKMIKTIYCVFCRVYFKMRDDIDLFCPECHEYDGAMTVDSEFYMAILNPPPPIKDE